MIEIIAHRGLWHTDLEKNTPSAFVKALELGFGIETDFRDQGGELVVEHDLSSIHSMKAQDFFELYRNYENAGTLAINIKADGLHDLLKKELDGKDNNYNYFCFDASVPDSLKYLKYRIPYYTRLSEYEPWTPLSDQGSGIWLDEFDGTWYTMSQLGGWLKYKAVCIVSPELHRRPHQGLWSVLRQELKSGALGEHTLSICTDFPEEAREFFGA